MATDSDIRCLFTARVEEQSDSYVIEVPKRELELGTLAPETLYRIALFQSAAEPTEPEARPQPSDEPGEDSAYAPSSAPVVEGETRVVEIDNIGDKGDGVARIDGGYVVIVADAEVGERLRVEMNQVRENVAFAEVVERLPYYE
ncbi:TRAM domain-containing protein [Haloarcula brevis]|uniref:TRAM domain-containing protein n=1 Tax=Haloarcula brevis TaxID=3111453 RepID=UPI00300F5FAE